MLKHRQLQALAGASLFESGWQLGQPQSILSVAGTYGVLAIGPTNLAGVYSSEAFRGTALAAAGTSRGIGVLNQTIGVLTGIWVFLPSTGNTGTIAINLNSAAANAAVTGPTVLVAAAATSTLNVGWNQLVVTVPSDRVASITSAAVTTAMQLFPGDVITAVAAVATLPLGTTVVLDIA